MCVEQYIQIKKVLEKEFPIVLSNIRQNHRDTRFNLGLPQPSNQGKGIPSSLIASKLRAYIQNAKHVQEQLGSPKSASDYSKLNGSCIDIGLCIIKSFELLYKKYIHKSAHFMVNIDSRKSKDLKKLFDTKYYQSQQQKGSNLVSEQNSEQTRTKSPTALKTQSKSILSIYERYKSLKEEVIHDIHDIKFDFGTNDFANIENAIINGFDQVTNKNFIISQFFTKITNESVDTITHEQLFEWLLLKMIQPMERAVIQIAKLMNDSYIRYKTTDTTFEKSVKLAKQQYQRQAIQKHNQIVDHENDLNTTSEV